MIHCLCSTTTATAEDKAIDEEVAAEKELHAAAQHETTAELKWRTTRMRLRTAKGRSAALPPQTQGTMRGAAAAELVSEATTQTASDSAPVAVAKQARRTVMPAGDKTAPASPILDGLATTATRSAQPLGRTRAGACSVSPALAPAAVHANAALLTTAPVAGSTAVHSPPPGGRTVLQQQLVDDEEEAAQLKRKRRGGRQVNPNSARQKRLRAQAAAALTAAGKDEGEGDGQPPSPRDFRRRGPPGDQTTLAQVVALHENESEEDEGNEKTSGRSRSASVIEGVHLLTHPRTLLASGMPDERHKARVW